MTKKEIVPSSKEELVNALRKISVMVSIAVDKGDDLTPITDNLPGIAEKIAEAGYTTQKKFDELMDNFPDLAKVPEIMNALSLAVYNPYVVEESPVATNPVSTDEVVEIYEKLFPGCKAK